MRARETMGWDELSPATKEVRRGRGCIDLGRNRSARMTGVVGLLLMLAGVVAPVRAASFAPQHLDNRHVERLMMVQIRSANEDGELFASSREHRLPPSRPDGRARASDRHLISTRERIGTVPPRTG